MAIAGHVLFWIAAAFAGEVRQPLPRLVDALLTAGIVALPGIVLSLLIFGLLWPVAGARLLGGHASARVTFRAVGYAFLGTGLVLAIVATAARLVLDNRIGDFDTALIHRTAVSFFLLWALGLSVVAVARLNHFGIGRALLFMLELVLVCSAVLGVFLLLR